MTKAEERKYQAQDDAYTMARYQEIMQDKGRAQRAIKVAQAQANNMQKQANAMKAVASTKVKRPTTRKK